MLLSIIIPVYNERSTVSEVVDTVLAVDLPCDREIIVVDDGSDDGTAECLAGYGEPVRLLTNPVNEGKGAAIRAGLAVARGGIILFQDADLETDPNEFRNLVDPILEGRADAVYGTRFHGGASGIPVSRRLANRFLTGLTNILYGTGLSDMETAYKAFSAEVASSLELVSDRFDIEPEITAKIALNGFSIREVPVSYRPRSRNEGKKIRFADGVAAVLSLIKWRIRGWVSG